MRGAFFTILLLNSVAVSVAAPIPAAPSLNDSERSGLRYRLENLFNEVDLAVRNHRSDELDLIRQRETIQGLKIFERIPFLPRIEEIRSQLAASAEESGLKLRSFRFLDKGATKTPEIPPVPGELFTDQRGFQLSPEQLADTIRFRVSIEGDKDRVREWVRGWQENIMRLMEPEGGARTPILQPLGGGRWEIEAWAFRFRNVRFPKLKVRNPLTLLPAWARRKPELFARQEPLLWNLVEKTEETAPLAASTFGNREQFLLNDARIGFFFVKAGATR